MFWEKEKRLRFDGRKLKRLLWGNENDVSRKEKTHTGNRQHRGKIRSKSRKEGNKG